MSTPLETRAGHETQPHELSTWLLPNRSKLRGMFLTGSILTNFQNRIKIEKENIQTKAK